MCSFFFPTTWCALVQFYVCLIQVHVFIAALVLFYLTNFSLSPNAALGKTKDISLKSVKNPLGDLKSMNTKQVGGPGACEWLIVANMTKSFQ